MGNWMTVNINGTCAQEDLDPLRKFLRYSFDEPDGFDNFGPLGIGRSICGLNEWVDEYINVVGNVAERDYDANDVADHLRKCLEVAPSLNVTVHCGGDYESLECVATVVCMSEKVAVLPPRIATLQEMDEADLDHNFFKAFMGIN